MEAADAQEVAHHKACLLAIKRRGQGEAVLFIQGTGLHGDGWRSQTGVLSSSFDCVGFDNRGVGASQPIGDAAITVEQLAEDALAVLDHLGLERAHVVGHSLGGCVALQLTLTAPADGDHSSSLHNCELHHMLGGASRYPACGKRHRPGSAQRGARRSATGLALTFRGAGDQGTPAAQPRKLSARSH